jgi:hypothetical protein
MIEVNQLRDCQIERYNSVSLFHFQNIRSSRPLWMSFDQTTSVDERLYYLK